MADGINLKVFLQPDFDDVKKQANELQKIVKESGDTKIGEQYSHLQQKLQAIAAIFQKEDFGEETFKALGKALQDAFTDVQKISSKLSSVDFSEGLKKYQEELNKTTDYIDKLEKKITKTKKSLTIDDKGNTVLKESTKDRLVSKGLNNKPLQRNIEVNTKGQNKGQNISSWNGLVGYKEALEKEGKINTQDYKEVLKLYNQILDTQKSIVQEQEKNNKELQETKNHQEDIIKNLKTEKNNTNNSTSNNQKIANDTFVQATTGRTNVMEHVSRGFDAIDSLNRINENAPKATLNLQNLNTEGKNNTSIFGHAVRNLTSYTLILGTIKKAGRDAIQTISVLDKSITEQAMVAGKTKQEMQGLIIEYQNLAKATGATTKEVAEVATQYFRQGKSTEEALVLTRAAVSAAKVGAISTADSVDYLTTAINGFQMAAEDAMKVSDKFAALAANSATNYEELAVALSKCASQANLAGMSMDYTLGLLAKGIETTREAPETIGTALKTIIARMREMTDYGKTLEGDVDINNLETQLSYVGIALRGSNGELRSTQEVLDEIGRSWNTFSANQQAALAKALAGTRQQSRLISIMQNYDRTLELVDISQNSIGATAGQMATYMDSLEAATNKVSVAWETLVTNLTNTEFVINLISSFGEVLNNFAMFANTDFGAFTIFSSIAVILLSILGTQIRKREIEQETLLDQQQEYVNEQKQQKLEALGLMAKSKEGKIQKAAADLLAVENKLLTIKAKKESIILRLRKGDQTASQELVSIQEEEADALNKKRDCEQQLNQAIAEAEDEKSEGLKKYQLASSNLLSTQQNLTAILAQQSGLFFVISKTMGVMRAIGASIVAYRKLETAEAKKQFIIDKKDAAIKKIKALFGMAESASEGGPHGWIIAAGILAIAGIAVAVAAAAGAFGTAEDKTDKAVAKSTESVGKLNAAIGKTNKRIQEINKAQSVFDEWDKHIIKTQEDVENLDKAIATVAEHLTDKQKNELNSKTTYEEKINYIKGLEEEEKKLIYQQQRLQLRLFDEDHMDKMLENADNKAVIYNIVTDAIKEQINQLKELNHLEKQSMIQVGSKLVQNIDAKDLYKELNEGKKGDGIGYSEFQQAWYNNMKGSGKRAAVKPMHDALNALRAGDYDGFINAAGGEFWANQILDDLGLAETSAGENYAKSVTQVLTTANKNKISVTRVNKQTGKKEIIKKTPTEILEDPTSTPAEIAWAYKQMSTAYDLNKSKFDTPEAYEKAKGNFESTYKDTKDFIGLYEKMDTEGQNYINSHNIDTNTLNTLKTEMGDIFGEDFNLVKFINAVGKGQSYTDAIKLATGKKSLTKEESQLSGAAISHFSNAHSGTVQTAVQEVDKILNDTKSLKKEQEHYRKGDMTATEYEELRRQKKWFFDDEVLKKQWESGVDFSQELLKPDSPLNKKIEAEKLRLEEKRKEAEATGAQDEIDSIDFALKKLNNVAEIFMDSLEDRIKAEEAFIEQYKKLKEEERDAQIKVLEGQKEAYQKYFDAIQEQESFENYSNQRKILIQNINSLGASTSATDLAKQFDYQLQLQELDKERLKELKENARNDMIQNIDNTIESINEKFDKLLENENKIIKDLTTDDNNLQNSTSLLQGRVSQIFNGTQTDLMKGKLLNDLLNDTLEKVDKEKLDQIIDIKKDNGNVTLAIGGDTYDLGSKAENSEIWGPILKTLTSLGIQ